VWEEQGDGGVRWRGGGSSGVGRHGGGGLTETFRRARVLRYWPRVKKHPSVGHSSLHHVTELANQKAINNLIYTERPAGGVIPPED
jgi:hypothetical protein